MKLYLTPLSHFSRKVVIVLAELGLDHEREHVPDLLSTDPADFGGNPILRVPVLEDGENWVVESDAIVRYLLERHDPGDRLGLGSLQVPQRNTLSVIASIMGAEVELILSQRSGASRGRLFDRHGEVIEHCLAWLERHGPSAWTDLPFSYLDVSLTCMWDHLSHSGLLKDVECFPWIAETVARHADRPSVRESSPEAMQELQWKLYPSQRPS
ncbi:MAG: glutathione S-transferase family protein [Acidobacteriota bacterium]